jgi:replication fork protection complex subunit Tof1/Swi1
VRRDVAKISASRHSRFGTTIAVTLNPKSSTPDTSSRQSLVLHRQQAISHESGSIMDMAKKQKSKRGNKLDELGREDNFSLEARNVLQELAKEFLVACFNRASRLSISHPSDSFSPLQLSCLSY